MFWQQKLFVAITTQHFLIFFFFLKNLILVCRFSVLSHRSAEFLNFDPPSLESLAWGKLGNVNNGNKSLPVSVVHISIMWKPHMAKDYWHLTYLDFQFVNLCFFPIFNRNGEFQLQMYWRLLLPFEILTLKTSHVQRHWTIVFAQVTTLHPDPKQTRMVMLV